MKTFESGLFNGWGLTFREETKELITHTPNGNVVIRLKDEDARIIGGFCPYFREGYKFYDKTDTNGWTSIDLLSGVVRTGSRGLTHSLTLSKESLQRLKRLGTLDHTVTFHDAKRPDTSITLELNKQGGCDPYERRYLLLGSSGL